MTVQLNKYRVFVLNTSDENNPVTEFAFLSIDGKYPEAWSIARAMLKGKNSEYSFEKDGKKFTFQGKELSVVKITEANVKQKKLSASEIKEDIRNKMNEIINNPKLNDKQKQEAMNTLLV